VRRRQFITLIGGAAAAWPLAARAQQSAMPVIGFLSGESPDVTASRMRAFRQGLSEAGYIEGRNVAIEYRWAENQFARLPALAADLVDRQVAVIVTAGFSPPIVAAKAATSRIPIVFAYGGDPVKDGFVTSLNHPGGNITGVTAINSQLVSTWLSLVGDLVPEASTIPAIYSLHEFAKVGGLMSYGYSNRDTWRLTGVHTGRILNGEKPAGLPVIQATKIELAINVKTAKTLGISFPLSLLGRADEVIE
jgi:ABC-type uncharacterized transport system substrate-binding protein